MPAIASLAKSYTSLKPFPLASQLLRHASSARRSHFIPDSRHPTANQELELLSQDIVALLVGHLTMCRSLRHLNRFGGHPTMQEPMITENVIVCSGSDGNRCDGLCSPAL